MTAPAPTRSTGWWIGFGGTLSLAMTIAVFPQFGMGVLAPFIVPELGLSRAALGSLTTAMYFVAALASPLAGEAAGSVGGRRVLSGMLVLCGAALALLALSPSFGWLVAGMAVSGVALAFSNPATNVLISEHAPVGRRGTLVGVKQSGTQFAVVFAGLTAPAVSLALGWRSFLGLMILAPLLGLGLTRRFIPADQTSGRLRIGPRRTGPRSRQTTYLALAAFCNGAGMAPAAAYLPLYAYEGLGLSVTAAGLVGTVMGLAGILGRILWGSVAERRSTSARVLVSLSLGAVGSVALIAGAAGVGQPAVWLGAFTFGATAGAWMAVGMFAAIESAGREATGRATGTISIGFFLGFVASPVLFGYLVDLMDGRYTAAWLGVMTVFGLAAAASHKMQRLATAAAGPGQETMQAH